MLTSPAVSSTNRLNVLKTVLYVQTTSMDLELRSPKTKAFKQKL